MKNRPLFFFIATLFLSATTQLAAQTGKTPPPPPPPPPPPTEQPKGPIVSESGQPFAWVEQNPEFPGGELAMMEYLKKNIDYPENEKMNGIQGTVWIGFIVNKHGKISDVKEIKGVKDGPGLTKEAIRVIKRMPRWKPGKMKGKKVKCFFQIPIKFTLK